MFFLLHLNSVQLLYCLTVILKESIFLIEKIKLIKYLHSTRKIKVSLTICDVLLFSLHVFQFENDVSFTSCVCFLSIFGDGGLGLLPRNVEKKSSFVGGGILLVPILLLAKNKLPFYFI